MKTILACVVSCLFLGCGDTGYFPSNAGPYVYYYLNNQTSQDLFMNSSFNSGHDWDTMILPYGRTTNFLITATSLPEIGKPSAHLSQIRLMQRDSNIYEDVYDQNPLSDSLWESYDFDSIPDIAEEHWTLVVVDSMLK
jgi:hypothetical protein